MFPSGAIAGNAYNLNISRYVRTAVPEPVVSLAQVHDELAQIESELTTAKRCHNGFLAELGLPPLL